MQDQKDQSETEEKMVHKEFQVLKDHKDQQEIADQRD